MKSIVFFKYVLTILFALYVTHIRADFTAKVQRVVDGDTIHVKDEAGKNHAKCQMPSQYSHL